MINTNFARLKCHACGNVGLDDGDDGFFYCMRCGSQAEDFVDTGVADEDFVNKDGDSHGALYMASHKRSQPTHSIKVEPFSQTPSLYQTLSQALEDTPIIIKEEQKNSFEDYEPDFIGPTEPADFGSGQQTLREEDYCTEVRMRYVMGIQLMIQYQCEVLVEKLKASPLICGIAGSVWLRFVASTQIFNDMWANETMLESESQGGKEYKEKARYAEEPRNIHSQRMILIWYRSLRKKIPLSCSLAVSYLACHIAREPVLPTDILRWTLEGKLPYLAAFVEIEKYIGCPSKACPLSASYMFRPSQAVPLQKLESLAASIAQSISLNLPPVNFYAIASRYLKQLSLPVEKILPYACRIYEWSMPPDLWLSASELRLPTRVSVMSIVIVALRILYNLNGFGKWEATLSTSVGPFSSEDCTGSLDSKSRTEHDAEAEVAFQNMGDLDREPGGDLSPVHKFESEAAEFLCCLEKRDDGVNEKYEYSRNLPTYLQYCKDVVFAGLEPLFEDHAEEMMLEKLWDFYLKSQKDFEAVEESDINLNQKRSRDNKEFVDNKLNENKRTRDGECLSCQPADNETLHIKPKPERSTVETQGMQTRATESLREAAIRLMKSDMEEKRFCYIPPRVKLKRHDYLHYARKRDDGYLTYSSHADYYILLRACARAAQVDIRVLHVGVLGFERRLAWIEKRIDHCLHLKPSNVSCRSCTPDVTDDHISLSNENLSP
ncbi:hypothetical protein Nepgr_011516 [Nepenthes gracilis]|uniref:TATA box-binding protein-associated factor RNA polymerase I subunit B n=1 Tax=Nepenthes gracilis TaxID=150966 RepID=A0AAD3XME1_NEPGR|nr:hypothetical protein Nepgr_011516 [Nepenthes gracilis]